MLSALGACPMLRAVYWKCACRQGICYSHKIHPRGDCGVRQVHPRILARGKQRPSGMARHACSAGKRHS